MAFTCYEISGEFLFSISYRRNVDSTSSGSYDMIPSEVTSYKDVHELFVILFGFLSFLFWSCTSETIGCKPEFSLSFYTHFQLKGMESSAYVVS